ncbi:MAG: hypothetical protein HY735_30715 [Verrucomicrobia bacterium]|nr:hypothetical protein [Verrucomicrobiota bacterium]
MLTLIFETVLKSSWQAAVLICLVLAVQTVLGRKLAARWRYSLWFLVLIRLLIPVTPESAFSVYNLAPDRTTYPRGAERRELALFALNSPSAVDAPESPAPVQLQETRVSQRRPGKARPWIVWPALGWLTGALIMSGYFAWGIARFGRRVRRLARLEDARVESLLEEAKRRVGIRSVVEVVETCETAVPAMYGLLRPRLLLPRDFRRHFSDEELRLVFLHELTHLRRCDHVINWVMLILSAIHWFNPLIWLAFARMRADRELACDEQVLSVSPEHQNKDYGQMLIRLLEGLPRPARLPGLIGIVENTNQLKRRITMIAKFKRPARWSVLLALPVIALGLITLTDAQTKEERPDKGIIAEIEKLGGKVKYDESRPDRPVVSVNFFNIHWWRPAEPQLKVSDDMLRRFEAFTELEELDLTHTQIADESLSHLKGLTKLSKLRLWSTKINGSGLRHLKALANLKELNLNNTHITGAGLAQLKDFSNLESLHLKDSTQLADGDLQHLAGLTRLKHLSFEGTSLTGLGLRHLKALTNLTGLHLSNTQVTDDGLANLKDFLSLESLNLFLARKVTDAGLQHPAGLTNLRSLTLGFSAITDSGLVHLKELQKLEQLDLLRTKIGDAGFVHLQNLTRLKGLTLAGTKITDASCEVLGGFTNLTFLHISDTDVTETGLARLKTLSKLEVLRLGGTKQVTDAALQQLQDFPWLKAVSLAGGIVSEVGLRSLKNLPPLEMIGGYWSPLTLGGPTITDSSLVHLKRLSKLESLSLKDTRISPEGIARLKEVPGLEALHLTGTQVTDSLLVHLLELPGLQALFLVDSSVTDVGLSYLKELKNLSVLDLKRTRITDAGLINLKSLRKLDQVFLTGTRVTDAGLGHLSELQGYLDLGGTQITDAGIAQLKKASKLRELNLRDTQVTPAGIGALKNALPNLTVSR